MGWEGLTMRVIPLSPDLHTWEPPCDLTTDPLPIEHEKCDPAWPHTHDWTVPASEYSGKPMAESEWLDLTHCAPGRTPKYRSATIAVDIMLECRGCGARLSLYAQDKEPLYDRGCCSCCLLAAECTCEGGPYRE